MNDPRNAVAKSPTRFEIKPAQAMMLFSSGTAAFVMASIGGRLMWDVLWTDLLNHNSNRSLSNALVMIPFGTLFVGLWHVVNFAGALVVSGGMAALAARRFGYVPLLVVVALLPASFLLIYLQDSLTPTATFFMDPPETPTQWDRIWPKWLYAMAPALLLSWGAQRVFFRLKDNPLH